MSTNGGQVILTTHILRMGKNKSLRMVSTLEEIEASENRQQKIKDDFRNGNDKISIKEIREMDKAFQKRRKETE